MVMFVVPNAGPAAELVEDVLEPPELLHAAATATDAHAAAMLRTWRYLRDLTAKPMLADNMGLSPVLGVR